MPDAERGLVDRMRSKGIRLTEQRRLVAELLETAKDHLDAETVYLRAHERDPNIHRATVYRTLNTLKKQGLVDELDLMHVTGGRHFYEIRPSSFHMHLVCTACGKVEEPGGEFWEELRGSLERTRGFKPEAVRLEVGGLCGSCKRRGFGTFT